MMQQIKEWCRSCFYKNHNNDREDMIPTGTFENNDDKDRPRSVSITKDTIILKENCIEESFIYTLETDVDDIINLDDGSSMWIETTYEGDEIKIHWDNTDSHLSSGFDGETFFKSKRIY